jgi:salicylate hydroxylase
MRGRALIGADGLHSTIRAAVAPVRATSFTGTIAWRALIDAEALPAGIARTHTGLWLGPGAHLVHYPISGGRQANVVAVTSGAERGADPRALQPAFARWSPQARGVIGAAQNWMPWPLYERDASQPWARGRIALMGDAAHAMVPHLAQGAAQAVEDAASLAGHLARQPDDTVVALRDYEQERQPRAARVQAEARRNGQIYQLPWPASSARDLVLRNLGPERLMARLDWLYGA